MTQTEFDFIKEALGAKHNELLKDIVAGDTLLKAQRQAVVNEIDQKAKKSKKEKSK